jgi:hypothetical protein
LCSPTTGLVPRTGAGEHEVRPYGPEACGPRSVTGSGDCASSRAPGLVRRPHATGNGYRSLAASERRSYKETDPRTRLRSECGPQPVCLHLRRPGTRYGLKPALQTGELARSSLPPQYNDNAPPKACARTYGESQRAPEPPFNNQGSHPAGGTAGSSSSPRSAWGRAGERSAFILGT